jgi:hypothetical protein
MRSMAILFFSFLFLLVQLQAQECPPPDSSAGLAAIEGQVRDAEAQVALGFAQITLSSLETGANLQTRSDPSGRFRFCDVPIGRISLGGHLGQLRASAGPISLKPGDRYSLILEMAPPGEDPDVGTLTGVVMDAGLGTPIEGAEVLLPQFGQTTITNSLGRFTFPTLPAGPVELRVSMLGYASRSGNVEVEFNRTIQTEILLSTEPVELDPIVVTAVRQRIVLPGLEDIERRINSGWGKFLLEDEIQQRSPMKLSHALFEAGVETGSEGRSVWIRRTGCGPTVYIDGVRVTHKSRAKSMMGAASAAASKAVNDVVTGTWREAYQKSWGDEDNAEMEAGQAINELVHPMDVIAVEVYRGPAETPGQYLDSNSQCGVVLIWTRRGNLSRE